MLFVISLGCAGENDILVSYKGGTITRGEFSKWIAEKRYSKDSILKNKKRQINKLKAMMIELISIEKANEEGFDKKEVVKKSLERTVEKQLMDLLYKNEIKGKATFNEPAVKIKQIFLRVKDYRIIKNKRKKLNNNELKAEFDKTVIKAKDIIKKLDDGEDFTEVAKKNSGNFSKKKGEDIGYITYDIMPPQYSKVAFSLEKGEHNKEPIKLPKGIYIIKVVDKNNLTEKNIDDIIEDKSQARRLRSRLERKYVTDFLDKLKKAKDVEDHLDKATSRKKTDIIFKIGDNIFTVDDLNKKMPPQATRPGVSKKDLKKMNDNRKKRMAENIFTYELLKRLALQKGLDKDPEYQKKFISRKNSIVSREYIKHIGIKNIKITEKEMKDEYNKNKEKKYYKLVTKNKRRIREAEPYKKVKEKIERILKNKKRSDNIREWKRKMLKEIDFKIYEEELEGK